MVWKVRGSRRYYYRTTRRNGRVVTECFGCGKIAELIAEIDAGEREVRAAEREAVRAARQALRSSERPIAVLFGIVEDIMTWVLIRAGYHRHDRGKWRRRKHMTLPQATAEVAAPPMTQEELDTVHDVFRRACAGDRTVMTAMRRFFDLFPDDMIALLEKGLVDDLTDRMIMSYTGNNLWHHETLIRKIEQMRAELAGPSPTAVVSLLAERIVTCWLDLYTLEISYRELLSNLPPRAIAHWDRRRDRANSRYLAALKSLAAVRKLGLPTTAIQMNFSGPPPAHDVEGPGASQEQVQSGK